MHHRHLRTFEEQEEKNKKDIKKEHIKKALNELYLLEDKLDYEDEELGEIINKLQEY